MESVPVRSLRNHSAEVLARIARGDTLTVTKDGAAVAVIGPVPRTPLGPSALVERFRALPPVDGVAMRREIDELLNSAL